MIIDTLPNGDLVMFCPINLRGKIMSTIENSQYMSQAEEIFATEILANYGFSIEHKGNCIELSRENEVWTYNWDDNFLVNLANGHEVVFKLSSVSTSKLSQTKQYEDYFPSIIKSRLETFHTELNSLTNQQIRLLCGELSTNEMRTAKAIFGYVERRIGNILDNN